MPPLNHWSEPAYNQAGDCIVCARGGFCQVAALELAGDIAANLIMAGAVHSTDYPAVRASVLVWMVREDVQGGDVLALGDRYLASLKEAQLA